MKSVRGSCGVSRVMVAVTVAVIVCLPGVASPQGGQFQKVDNPFQDEFDYTVNTDLAPGIEADGVRWVRFAVRTKEEIDFVAGSLTPVSVELDLFNTAESAKVLVIVLFEDENGGPLGRIECDRVNTGRNRLRESVQRFKIDGSVLLATRKVYLLFEVLR